MTTVVLTGSDGALGPRTRAALTRRGVEHADAGAGGVTAAVSAVVDLGSGDHDRRAAARESATERSVATLDLADALDADHVVFVSSALVYGAHPNNPIPLSEQAVLRPEVEFVYARQLASAEELVEQWRRDRSGRTTTILRPVLALAADGQSQLTRALVAGFGYQLSGEDPPAQFLHLDDLAEAIAVAVERRLDGVYNVAPDGWVAGARVRALSGERPRVPLPERLSELMMRTRWKLLRGPIPPGLLPYTRHPWVVSNGRLRGEGWAPTVTNEQAYVEGTDAPWWAMVSPRRRQELALAGGAAAAVGVAAALVALGRWISRRRTGRGRF